MINFLRGKIILKESDYLILEVGNIGFKIFCPKKDWLNLALNQEVELFTYFYRTQNLLELYGFLTKEEEEFFELLVDVPSIGPKAALSIIGLGPIEKLKEAIEQGDEKFFSGLVGVGRKRIQTMILELSGKLTKSNLTTKSSENNEVIEALLNLGVPKQKIKELLSQVPEGIEGTENIVREILKRLGK